MKKFILLFSAAFLLAACEYSTTSSSVGKTPQMSEKERADMIYNQMTPEQKIDKWNDYFDVNYIGKEFVAYTPPTIYTKDHSKISLTLNLLTDFKDKPKSVTMEYYYSSDVRGSKDHATEYFVITAPGLSKRFNTPKTEANGYVSGYSAIISESCVITLDINDLSWLDNIINSKEFVYVRLYDARGKFMCEDILMPEYIEEMKGIYELIKLYTV